MGNPPAADAEINDAKKAGVQPVIVGSRSDGFAAELIAAMGDKARSPVELAPDKWQTPYLMSYRTPGEVWCVIFHGGPGGLEFADVVPCVQSLDLTLRPTRLFVLSDFLREDQTLALLQAGATSTMPRSTPTAEVLAELERPRSEAQEIVANPYRWLRTLSRVGEELNVGHGHELQLRKLLRLFGSELRVERSSILLLEGEKMRLAAGYGLPEDLKQGALLDIAPESISAWVIRNRRARLVTGQVGSGAARPGGVRTAVCAPLVAREQVIGIVNFSSMEDGRALVPADMAAADVFASLIAFAITNRELHERALESERLAAVGGTMSSVSHCMKNILTIFKGTTGILGRAIDKQDFGQMGAAHELLERGVRRLENTVLDLLDFSKAREPQLSAVQVPKFLAETCETFFTPTVSRLHTLELDCEVDGMLMLDEYRLARALSNILSNALEATPTGGRINLVCGVDGPWVKFAVSDSGPGVPTEKLDQIFARFYSTKGSTGTGLGLAMVSKFAEENGGRVDASNDAELGGLCVEIILPAIDPGTHAT